ncbi:TonB-dependent receptor [Marinicaulis flavus]|uniref:TonB-dependent receptor n=2 Tax=Hyphococcus luteus TaxID=2058213 RepID=A0A2S7KB99_9PROT|nr:TonB-dependent receptor [Marinicaulis flavus]
MKKDSTLNVFAARLLTGVALGAVAASGAAAQADQIVVTATKRAQTLQEVPIAVSVVSDDTIKKAQIQDILDLQFSVPSLRVSQLQNSSQTNFIIRGFGNGANNPGIESSVGVFIDGVYRSRSAAAILDLPVLERVEVLRGPQSTLFGKNTSAGAISITTKEPEYELGGSVEASYGNFDQVLFSGTVTGPLSDTLAFRVSGSINKREGYYTNTVTGNDTNERDRWSTRAELLFQPSDVLSFRLIGDYNKIDEECCGAIQLFNGPATLAIGAPSPFGLGELIDPAGDTDYSVALNTTPSNELTGKGISLQGDWDLGGAQLTSITAYRKQSDNTQTDADFSAADIITNPQDRAYKTFTQELRLASTGDNMVDWLVGAFYFDENVDFTRDVISGTQTRAFIDGVLAGGGISGLESSLGLPAGTFLQAGNGYFGDYEMDNKSYSIYGQADVHLTDRLTLTGGVSWIKDKKDYTLNDVNNEPFYNVDLVEVGFGGAFANITMLPPTPANIAALSGSPLPLAALSPGIVINPATGAPFASTDVSTIGTVAGAIGATPCDASNPALLCNAALALSPLQFLPVPVNVPDPGNPLDDGKLNDDKVTYTARIAYDVTDSLNAYFSYSTGWKAGAVNLSSDSMPPDPTTGFGREAGPEDVELFELGFKAQFDRGYLNVAIFDQTIQGFQSNLFIGDGFVLANADEQSVRGFEVEGAYAPIDALSLTAGVTYLDPEYDSFEGAPCSSFEGFDIPECDAGASFFDASGFTPAGISPWSVSTSATYTHDFANAQGYLRAEYLYESNTQVVDNVPAGFASREVNVLNLSLGVEWDNGFEIMGWARNLTDDQYLLSAFPTVIQPGSYSGYLAPPRTYGVTVRKSF